MAEGHRTRWVLTAGKLNARARTIRLLAAHARRTAVMIETVSPAVVAKSARGYRKGLEQALARADNDAVIRFARHLDTLASSPAVLPYPPGEA